MDQPLFPTALIVAAALGASGIYLLLSIRGDSQQTGWRWTGIGLAGCAGILFLLLALRRVDWWPESTLGSWAGSSLVAVLIGLSLIAAVVTVTSRRSLTAVLSFATVLVANAGLMLLGSAQFVAVATVLVYLGVVVLCSAIAANIVESRATAEPDGHEPLLICLTGGLLSVALIGSIQFALAAEAQAVTDSPRFSALPKRHVIETALMKAGPRIQIDAKQPHVRGLGRTLFRDHFVSVGIAAVLLMLASVAAVLMTRPADRAGTLASVPHGNPAAADDAIDD